MNAPVDTLPLYPRLDEIAEAIARSGPLVLHAEPGAGKGNKKIFMGNKSYRGRIF